MRCPHCGTPLRLFVEVAGEADVAPARTAAPGSPPNGGSRAAASRSGSGRPAAAAQPRVMEANITDEGVDEILCPNHGWSVARRWPANEKGGACVQCQAKNRDGRYCTVRVPLELFLEMAGVA